MFCENCGAQLEDGQRFCTRCGYRVSPIENVVSRPNVIKRPEFTGNPIDLPRTVIAQRQPVKYGRSNESPASNTPPAPKATYSQPIQPTPQQQAATVPASSAQTQTYAYPQEFESESSNTAVSILVGLLVTVLVLLIGFISIWALGYGNDLFGSVA